MKAAVLNQSTYLQEMKEVETPTVSSGKVLIGLKSASLNHHELWSMEEKSVSGGSNIIMGSDGAGIVKDVGEGVDTGLIGKEVLINPSLKWGDDPRATGPEYEILGFPTTGTFAQFISISSEYVYEKPHHLSFEESAALPLAGLTAYRALFTKGQVKKGDKVLITGIGGGAALYALQFAVASGARVYVTSGSQKKIEAAIKLGAVNGVNYKNADWPKELRELTSAFDVIIDSAAGKGFPDLTDLAAFGGRIVLFGRTAGAISELNPRTIFWKQLSILGTTMGNQQEFTDMLQFVNVHKVKPVIDRVFSLHRIQDGFIRMRSTEQFGKIVISMEGLE